MVGHFRWMTCRVLWQAAGVSTVIYVTHSSITAGSLQYVAVKWFCGIQPRISWETVTISRHSTTTMVLAYTLTCRNVCCWQPVGCRHGLDIPDSRDNINVSIVWDAWYAYSNDVSIEVQFIQSSFWDRQVQIMCKNLGSLDGDWISNCWMTYVWMTQFPCWCFV